MLIIGIFLFNCEGEGYFILNGSENYKPNEFGILYDILMKDYSLVHEYRDLMH